MVIMLKGIVRFFKPSVYNSELDSYMDQSWVYCLKSLNIMIIFKGRQALSGFEL